MVNVFILSNSRIIKNNIHSLLSRHPIVHSLVGTPLNCLLTLLVSWFLILVAPPLMTWTILDAGFLPAEPATCQETTGACWSFVIAKSRQILLGVYPFEEQWRPIFVCIIILSLLGYSVRPSSWHARLVTTWLIAVASVLILMRGGVLGLHYVPSALWGGLPVTLILTVVIGAAFPLSIILALARRSDMPFVRIISTTFIELVRATPLLSLLFIASIMLPIFLPEALLPDKFIRALVALLMFASAYLAEVVRGGLQAITRGQFEAAEALGLSYWQKQKLIILPQALRIVIPSLANTIIVMIKNTSLIFVIGLFDMISSGRAALADPEWQSPAVETYLFICFIYFMLTFCFSRFSNFLELRNKDAL